MVIGAKELGQGEVKAGVRLRPGSHLGAKARGRRLGTVNGHDEDPLAAALVDRIAVAVVKQHSVLDGDGGQLAGAYAQEGIAPRRVGIAQYPEGLPLPLRREQIRLAS